MSGRFRAVVAVLFVLLIAGAVVATLLLGRGSDPYPTTPEGWNAWLDQRLARHDRVRGEGWDVWLDAADELGPIAERVTANGRPFLLDPADDAVIAEQLDRLVPIGAFTHPWEIYPSVDQFESMFNDTRDAREIVRGLVHPRLVQTLENGDFAAAAGWIDRGDAVRRVLAGGGPLTGFLTDVAVASLMLEEVRAAIIGLPADESAGIEAMQSSVASMMRNDPAWVFEAEAALSLPYIADFARSTHLQTLAQVIEYDDALQDAAAAAERFMDYRRRLDNARVFRVRRAAADLTLPAADRVWPHFPAIECNRGGTVVLVALLRARADTGRFPASLDELVPAYLDALPADPYSADGAFAYRVLDSTADTLRAGVVLSSVGPDGVAGGPERGAHTLGSSEDAGDVVFTMPPEQEAEREGEPGGEP